jgi:uncharacterized protein (DUF4415 family)/uncharacterized DUF497 family protein
MVWFEWDEAKAKTNERKHGVRFDDAILVFSDPYALMEQDRIEGGELRWQTIGLVGGVVQLLVAPSGMREGMKSFASFQRERPRGRSANNMTKIVRKTLADIRVNDGSKRRLKKLAERPDSDINLSDIPELTEKFWRNAVRNPFYRPVKKQLTLRLDADVIAWLRRQGKGYQTRANALLRAAMLEDVKEKAS